MTVHDELRTRFRGALLGLTVGDSLAFPFRGRSREFSRTRANCVERGFEKHESGFFPVGQYSDDSQSALAVATAIAGRSSIDRQAIAEAFVPLWRDQLVVEGAEESSRAMEDFVRGRTPIEDVGHPVGLMEGDALPRVVPVGLWCHSDYGTLPAEASKCSSITHHDPRVHAAAAGVAAAVAYVATAEEIVLGVFLDRLAAAVGKFHGETAEFVLDFPRLLSITERRVFEEIGTWVAREGGKQPDGFNAGVPNNCLFLFVLAIYYFLKSPFVSSQALAASLVVGGETTTLCALVGALCGAFQGEEGVPGRLAETVLQPDETLAAADALFRARADSDKEQRVSAVHEQTSERTGGVETRNRSTS